MGVAKTRPGSSGAYDLPTLQTRLVIAAYENIGIGNFTSEITTGTLWILSADDYDAVVTEGLSKAVLDANNQAKAFESIDSPTFGTPDLEATDVFRLLTSRGTAVYDELRIGTELSDVFIIPEPASLVLVSFGSLCLLSRRRA